MNNKGVFITLEGGDGTGKSTQIKLLQEALNHAGLDVVMTREPGGTPQAEKIRNLMLQRDSGHFNPLTELLMMFASRREHLVDKIWPALKNNQWVISDRFADSSRAFQGYGLGVPLADVEAVYKMVAGGFEPQLTFIFDIDPEIGLKRTMRRQVVSSEAMTEDRYERMGLPFHQKLRTGFLEIAKRFPERCVVIDATQDIATIHRQLLSTISKRFGVDLKEVKYG